MKYNLMFIGPCTNLDSWIKRDQLDVTYFIISLLNGQHVSDVNTSILRSLRLICWVISWVVLLWYDVCWCYVVVWLGWCGIRMQAEAVLIFWITLVLDGSKWNKTSESAQSQVYKHFFIFVPQVHFIKMQAEAVLQSAPGYHTTPAKP